MINFLVGRDLRLHVASFEADKGSLVAHLVAVVRGREHGEALAALLVLKALVLYFMGSNYELCKLSVHVLLHLPKLFFVKNFSVTSGPNMQEMPRFEGILPGMSLGSDHKQSTMIPSSAGSLMRAVFLTISRVTSSFENRPPCVTNTLALMQ